MQFNFLSESFAVSEQINPEDIQKIKDEGFTAIVNNRPDNEAEGQPLSSQIEKAAKAAGLEYIHIPMVGPNYNEDDINHLTKTIANNSKVFAFCRTGNRSSILWNAAQ